MTKMMAAILSGFPRLYRLSSLMFLMIFLMFGIIFVFLIPPGYGPDEEGHFFSGLIRVERIFDHSEEFCAPYFMDDAFHITNVIGDPSKKIPVPTYEPAMVDEPPFGKHCVSRHFPDKIYGHFLSYPGIAIARMMVSHPFEGNRYLRVYYLSRICQLLLVGLALFFLTLNLYQAQFPSFGGLFILCVSLTPIFVQQSSVISADTVVNAFAIACSNVLIFSMQLKKRDVILYGVLGALAATTKPVLLPVFFAVAVFFATKSELRWTKIFVLSELKLRWRDSGNQILFMSLLLPFLCVFAYLSAKSSGGVRPLATANPTDQLRFVVQNPVEVGALFYRTLLEFVSWNRLLFNLGWLDTSIFAFAQDAWNQLFAITWYIEVVAMIVCVVTLVKSGLWNKKAWPKVVVQLLAGFFSFFAYGGAIILTMYFYWTRVGYLQDVGGLQPRYFISLSIITFGFAGGVLFGGHEGVSIKYDSSASSHRWTIWTIRLLGLVFGVWIFDMGQKLVVGAAMSILARYH